MIAVIGDGSFGLTAMEIDTAVRSGARAVFVVANNEAWGIERNDQLVGYDGNLVGVDLPGCRYDLERFSYRVMEHAVAAVPEPTQSIPSADGIEGHPSGFDQRFPRSGFDPTQYRLDLGEGLLYW